ncbi:glutaredoxin [Pseudomonas fluorescens]|uniref:Glutathione S-transferase N-terminal domain-containing protein n=1 Tax=Pseudomonas lactucae TaxID=2813360 RepID=A0A9X0Y9N8_9PSED|nr:glutathione S-transferase N-terminal domain-containing protein [Pseudomonas lactucae]OPA87409.1 glutaredoxin [Pseudomonas fluorescens]MBN2976093.1 glutathione S-transferase N-terminal domain-containing protein [Pseudomonas lactucae]MBN2985989.1 glutathione S-transferase N-terminal domain-containing protein [Pseudomonas lactucae]OPB07038.1 glutaredoxin [Pseudomonas fluorescens]OPB18354.1 glutaredoxin [Pseudomonas fluorescens]
MFVKALRVGLGHVIIAGDFLTRPRKQQRPAEQQAQVNDAAKGLTLYQFHACPFCVKTRRTLHRLNVPVALKDAKNNEQDRQTLLEQGGKIKVPCLRIEENGQTTWMYDSKVIIDYLNKRFAAV